MVIESGYNLQPGTWRKSQLDEFYIELPQALESRNLSEELAASITALQAKQNYALLDDGSPLAQALCSLFLERISLSQERPTPERSKFQQELYSRFGIWQEDHLLAFSLAYEMQRPLLLASCCGRIFNYNYRRVSRKEIARPYWVYGYPESLHKAQLAAQALGLTIIFDVFQSAPRLMRAYFLHPLHLEMYQAATLPFPHNDHVERQIWLSVLKGAGDMYPPRGAVAVEGKKPPFEQAAHIPIHALIKKYFGAQHDINQSEIDIYGEAY